MLPAVAISRASTESRCARSRENCESRACIAAIVCMSGTDALSLRAISASSSRSRAVVRCCQSANATPPITTTAPSASANSRLQRRRLGFDRLGDPLVRVARASPALPRTARRRPSRAARSAMRTSALGPRRPKVITSPCEHAAMIGDALAVHEGAVRAAADRTRSTRRDRTRAARRGASRRRARRPDRSGDRCSDAVRSSRPASRTASHAPARRAGEDAELDRHGSDCESGVGWLRLAPWPPAPAESPRGWPESVAGAVAPARLAAFLSTIFSALRYTQYVAMPRNSDEEQHGDQHPAAAPASPASPAGSTT